MRKELKKELDEIAPFLAGDKPKEAFKVPYNYFDLLPSRVLERLAESQPQAEKPSPVGSARPPWWQSWLAPRVAWAMAGTALLVATIVVWQVSRPSAMASPDLTEEEIFQYILDNPSDFSEDLIMETLTENETPLHPAASQLDAQDIEQYLDELDPEEIEDLL